jgi:threonine/homoserine/homoserine lactone efflux protein
VSLARLTKQEFWVAAGNPKAILVFTAFFPQFVDRGAYATSFAILGATFLLLELVAIVIYAALGARLGSLSRGARGFTWFNRVSGALMIGFGVMLAFVRRPAT